MNAIELSAMLGAGALMGGPRHRVAGAIALPAAVYGILMWGSWFRHESVATDALVARIYGVPAPSPKGPIP